MRRTTLIAFGILAPLACAAATAQNGAAPDPSRPPVPAPPAAEKPAKPVQAVIADPPVVFAGEPVTLRWYFTGKKVTVSGGRFGTGAVVTGRTAITDRPAKTTRYTFNVDYVGEKTNEQTGKVEQAPLHATYTVVAEVAPPIHAEMVPYKDRYGWQISCLKGWKRDTVSYPDPANNALMFFQQEDDSVERMAVSVLPAESMTAADLMSKVQKSLTSNYEQLQVISDMDTTYAGVPAVYSIFTGMDQAHPGTKTKSILLAFVRNNRAYVLSARTSASDFPKRRPLLEKMVRSFSFAPANVTASR